MDVDEEECFDDPDKKIIKTARQEFSRLSNSPDVPNPPRVLGNGSAGSAEDSPSSFPPHQQRPIVGNLLGEEEEGNSGLSSSIITNLKIENDRSKKLFFESVPTSLISAIPKEKKINAALPTVPSSIVLSEHEKRECGPAASYRRRVMLAGIIKNLAIKQKRELFQLMRNGSEHSTCHEGSNEDAFLPKYGFTAGDFSFYHVVHENHRKPAAARRHAAQVAAQQAAAQAAAQQAAAQQAAAQQAAQQSAQQVSRQVVRAGQIAQVSSQTTCPKSRVGQVAQIAHNVSTNPVDVVGSNRFHQTGAFSMGGDRQPISQVGGTKECFSSLPFSPPLTSSASVPFSTFHLSKQSLVRAPY